MLHGIPLSKKVKSFQIEYAKYWNVVGNNFGDESDFSQLNSVRDGVWITCKGKEVLIRCALKTKEYDTTRGKCGLVYILAKGRETRSYLDQIPLSITCVRSMPIQKWYNNKQRTRKRIKY